MKSRVTRIHPKKTNDFNGALYANKVVNFADLVSTIKGVLPNPMDLSGGIEYTLEDVEEAVINQDFDAMREISQYFYINSGIYAGLIRYLSTLMNNDYRLNQRKADPNKSVNEKKVEKTYHECLTYLDTWHFKTQIPEINFYIIRDGAFYGYLIETDMGTYFQRLPNAYCRSIYKNNGFPIVEFDVKYFDDTYTDATERDLIIKNYPIEIQSYYKQFKSGKIKSTSGSRVWCPLDVYTATVFRFFNTDAPILFGSIKELIRLALNRAIDDKKAEQQLFKILIQEMPLDKEYNLVFDIDEAKDMHSNTLAMVKNAPGVDVLTTFAKTSAINLNDGLQSTQNGTKNATKGAYDEAGVSPNVMATEGNISLQYSVGKDEKLMYYMLNQVGNFINLRLSKLFNSSKSVIYSVRWLDTTQYNYKDKFGIYKEGATLGYSKLMPALATGDSQSEFEANLDLENNQLKLNEIMKPLESSYAPTSDKGGAPVKADSDKQDSTLNNQNGGGSNSEE